MLTAQEGNKERKTVFYTKVSTPERPQGESSRTVQIKVTNDYLKRRRLQPLSRKNVYVDFGSSSNRPALSKLLDDVKNGGIKTILVWHIDRLTRSITEWARLMDIFSSHNVSLRSIQQGFRQSPAGMKMLSNGIKEFERRRSAKLKRKNR